MPQVRVAEADEQVDEEEGEEKTFDHQEVFAFGSELFDQRVALKVTKHRACDEDAPKTTAMVVRV
jgi:hypothetical protein